MNAITVSLLITLIGMGLVFLAIMLIWLVMVLLVRVTARNQAINDIVKTLDLENKQKAAIAVLALANALKPSTQIQEFPLPPTALVSAWQAVMRSNSLFRNRGSNR